MRKIYQSIQTSITGIAFCIFVVALLILPSSSFAEGKRLDITGLKEMLVNLGYEPEEFKYSDGEIYYVIRPKVQGRSWIVTARAPDGRNMYLQMKFSSLPDDKDIPQQVLVALLKENSQSTYSKFFLSNSKYFMLSGSMVNRGVTPADIRKTIDEMTTVAARTEKHWDAKKWTKMEANKTAPENETVKKEDAKTEEAKKEDAKTEEVKKAQ